LVVDCNAEIIPLFLLNICRTHYIQKQLTTPPWFRTDKRRVARGLGGDLKEVEGEYSPNSFRMIFLSFFQLAARDIWRISQ
jgi:hypothetical protein